MNTKLLLQVFILGSSLFSTIITQAYVGFANNKKKIIKNYEMFVPLISIIFGVFAVIAYKLYKTYNKLKNYVFLIIGAILGLLLSGIGSGMELPTKLFDFTKENKHLVYPIAMVLYSGIFELVVKNLILYSI